MFNIEMKGLENIDKIIRESVYKSIRDLMQEKLSPIKEELEPYNLTTKVTQKGGDFEVTFEYSSDMPQSLRDKLEDLANS